VSFIEARGAFKITRKGKRKGANELSNTFVMQISTEFNTCKKSNNDSVNAVRQMAAAASTTTNLLLRK